MELVQYFKMRYLIKSKGKFLSLALISKKKHNIAS